MDSLAGYDSDLDAPVADIAFFQMMTNVSPDQRLKDMDTNYDNIAMDESDQEMNNNVEEYYSADGQEGVNPEDAPLVFRTITEPRHDIRTTPLHRNSSDMEVDDSDSEDADDQSEKIVSEEDRRPVPSTVHETVIMERTVKTESRRSATPTEEENKVIRPSRCKRTRSLGEEKSDKSKRSPSHSPCRKVSRTCDEVGRHQGNYRSEDRKRNQKRPEAPSSYRNTPSRGKPAKNPMLQIQKNKLIWGNKNNGASATSGSWDSTVFKNDFDGKVAEKFKRLMGIKNATPKAETAEDATENILQEQEEMFSNMEAQYQQARVATHTQRGCGLGYGSLPARSTLHRNS